MIYKKHIFICTNQRPEGARICCGEQHGTELVAAFKKEIKERNLQIEMRAQKTGCFDLCERGPMVAVYPDAVFYGKVQLSDVSEIVESHLINNKVVERLVVEIK